MHAQVEDTIERSTTWCHLHAHEEVSRLPPVETALRELPTHPLHLGALLRRAEVGVELPHRPAEEVVGRLQRWAAPLGDLEPPHGGQQQQNR